MHVSKQATGVRSSSVAHSGYPREATNSSGRLASLGWIVQEGWAREGLRGPQLQCRLLLGQGNAERHNVMGYSYRFRTPYSVCLNFKVA